MKNKLLKLELLIDFFAVLPCIFITETWLTNDDLDSCLPYSDYFSVFRCDRSEGLGGGVAVLIPRNIQAFSPLPVMAVPEFEVVWVQILFMQTSIRFGLVYRRPLSSSSMPGRLIDYLNSVLDPNVPTVLLGDFNYPDINWTRGLASARDGQRTFLHFTFSAGLDQMVRFPTRKENVLDLVFVTEPNLVQCLEIGPKIENCDHETIVGSFVSQVPNQNAIIEYRDFWRADYESLQEALLFVRWDELLEGVTDVNVAWNIFLNVLKPLLDRFVPLRRHSRFVSRCSRVSRLCHRTYLLHKRYKATKTQLDYEKYLQASRLAQRAKRVAKFDSENRILESGDLSRFWHFVRSRLTVKSSIPLLTNSQGEVVVGARDRATLFNEYFSSVFIQDNGTQPTMRFPQATTVLTNIEFQPAQVYAFLSELPSKTSVGPDGIPSIFLKRLSLVLAEPLSRIFTISFDLSQFPTDWLGANVIPIYKQKGSSSACCFYRPISLLCKCANVSEAIVADLVKEHMQPFWFSGQHGFLKGRSTVTQLLECLNDWTKAIDAGQFVDVLYVDIAKAFDSVSHVKLLAKLSRYGIQGKLLGWIRAFLTGRRQRVKVDGHFSDWLPVGSGVPQGSVLGPILFLIYINDLPLVLKWATVKIFADDLKVYVALMRNDTTFPLQLDIHEIFDWTDESQLSIAFEKCFILHLGTANPRVSYTFGHSDIQSVNSIRDLGVILQHDLKFHEHCAKVVRSSSIMSNLIFRSFYSRKPEFLLKMFQTFVRPRLEYATQIWNPCYKMDIDLIEKVQRKFTKRIPGMYSNSYSDRLACLDLNSLEYRRIVFDLVMVYKILRGLVEIDSSHFFFLSEGVTRGHSWKLFKNRVRSDVSRFFFTNRVIDIWNFLPDDIVSKPTLQGFKTALKSVNLSRFLRGGALMS